MPGTKRIRARKCSVCGGVLRAAPLRDNRRHSCVTLTEKLMGELPASCWQRLPSSHAVPLLKAIPALKHRDNADKRSHENRVAMAREILESSLTGGIEAVDWKSMIHRYGTAARYFCKALPSTSPIREYLQMTLDRITCQKKAGNQIREKAMVFHADLPEEFGKAIQFYAMASERRLATKQERGHDYDPGTARRRARDAMRFCAFLAQRGRAHWAEVSQQDLDEYISVAGRSASLHAHTFLRRINDHFQLRQRFVRPRTKQSPPVMHMFSPERFQEILRRIMTCEDIEVVVAALFLALFAQTVAHSATLHLSNFRWIGKKLQARFCEQWLPLDA